MDMGYWQVDNEGRKKTSFIRRKCLPEFAVSPFGHCNTPATFERLVEIDLVGLHWRTLL